MKQIKILKIVNMLLFLDFLIVLTSVLFYKIIPGNLNGSEMMAEMHETSGMIFGILVLVHLTLNFKWVKMNYFTPKKK
jgi:hypothetical protein